MRCAGCHGCDGADASHPWAARTPVSIILALLIDRGWGEPPARFHPVVWMGSYLKRAGRGLPDRGPRMAFFLGTLYWLAGAALVAAVYGVAGAESARLPPWLDIVLTAVLLKPLFALRLLLSEVGAVESSLMQGVVCGRARPRRVGVVCWLGCAGFPIMLRAPVIVRSEGRLKPRVAFGVRLSEGGAGASSLVRRVEGGQASPAKIVRGYTAAIDSNED